MTINNCSGCGKAPTAYWRADNTHKFVIKCDECGKYVERLRADDSAEQWNNSNRVEEAPQ